MSVTDSPYDPSVQAGRPMADIGYALFTGYDPLAISIGAQTTAQGQYVDASRSGSALGFAVRDISEYWDTSRKPQPLGVSNHMNTPY